MIDKLRLYVEKLFEGAPKTRKAYELKEELLANLIDKYNDLIASGQNESEAYTVAIASIGDVDELIAGLKESNVFDANYMQKERKKSALLVSVAVMMYILSPIALIVAEESGEESVLSLLVMFVMVAIATGLLIYNGMTRPRYNKQDDTIVEEFKEWKSENTRQHQMKKSVTSALWSIIVAIYFVISFLFGIWAYSWIIFIIGAAIKQVIVAYFDIKGSDK